MTDRKDIPGLLSDRQQVIAGLAAEPTASAIFTAAAGLLDRTDLAIGHYITRGDKNEIIALCMIGAVREAAFGGYKEGWIIDPLYLKLDQYLKHELVTGTQSVANYSDTHEKPEVVAALRRAAALAASQGD